MDVDGPQPQGIRSGELLWFHEPTDEALLAAYGLMSILHVHLKYALRHAINSLTGEGSNASTKGKGATALCALLSEAAQKEFGPGDAAAAIENLLIRCGNVSDRRNHYVHSVVAEQGSGEKPHIGDDSKDWDEMPTDSELLAICDELRALRDEVYEAAAPQGFIAAALRAGKS